MNGPLATPRGDDVGGYAHSRYAGALAEFGNPRQLPRSGGWILERGIADSPDRDAMGPYPLFHCVDWSGLPADLDAIDDLVSLAMVPSPFGYHTPELLAKWFPDVCRPFKQHYIVDLREDPATYIAANHRRNARMALGEVEVEFVPDAGAFLDDWTRLYDLLVERHSIRGIAAFSRTSFAKQLAVPGILVARAVRDGETVGAVLWYGAGETAYYHLGAYSDVGYHSRASFGIFWASIQELAGRVRWLALGAGAGTDEGTAGLDRFKRGWATGTRPVYFCGRIFDRERYETIQKAQGTAGSAYFPAYRHGEF